MRPSTREPQSNRECKTNLSFLLCIILSIIRTIPSVVLSILIIRLYIISIILCIISIMPSLIIIILSIIRIIRTPSLAPDNLS